MAVLKPQRGEVWWVRFDPSVGTEIQKTRPAIIISNNISNRHLDRFQVVPLTSQIGTVYPGECLVNVNKQTCKALVDQIRTASTNRLSKKITNISESEMDLVNEVLIIQLGLE